MAATRRTRARRRASPRASRAPRVPRAYRRAAPLLTVLASLLALLARLVIGGIVDGRALTGCGTATPTAGLDTAARGGAGLVRRD